LSYGTEYIDIPELNKITPRVGKTKQMAKTTNEAQKPAKRYAKTRTEHYKDILIAVLVTGIVAFIAGSRLTANNNQKIVDAVNSVIPVSTEVKK